MAKRKTHDQYVSDVAIVNPDIEVVGTYINYKTKILHRCKIDKYEWYVAPNNILAGSHCPLCMRKRKTTQTFIEEMKIINDSIEIMGTYVNGHHKILCKCKIDGHQWSSYPINLLNGSGCPKCSGVKHKTHTEYVNEVAKIHNDIEIVGEYVNIRTPILHRCKKDGTVWLVDPHHILSGRGCPKCCASYGEKLISDYLEQHNITFNSQYTFSDCKNIFKLPFDFYLPDYNVCIEYDGLQHFVAIDFFGGENGLAKRQHNDRIKNNFCDFNNIELLRIKYDDDIIYVLNKFFDKLINTTK